MNWKTGLLIFYFVAFTGFALYVLATEGFAEAFRFPFVGGWASQVTLDLVTALVFAVVWMVKDARTRGVPAIPWVVLTALTGSIGPLAYLIRRELAAPRARADARLA